MSGTAVPHVLVLAPEFPAINQPWMDTYLEQLQKHGATFEICSYNRSPENYHRKVDDNGWRRLVHLPAKSRGQLIAGIVYGLKNPSRLFRDLQRARAISGRLAPPGMGRLKSMAKLMYFASRAQTIKKPDIIHGHAEVMSYEFLHLAEWLGVPLVLTFHGPPPPRVANLSSDKRRILYSRARGVLVNTQYAADLVVALGCDADRISIIPQGLPLEAFPFANTSELADGDALQLLSVSRLQRDKGHRYVFIAIRRLLDRGVRVRYHIVGTGPELDYLTTLSKRLGVYDMLTFHGSVDSDELRTLYSRSHVFVLASCVVGRFATETQGVALLEALASGCLSVASAVGGVPEAVGGNNGAILVRQRSSREIADAACRLVADRASWPDLRSAGRDHIEQHYASDVIGDRVFEYLIQNIQAANDERGVQPDAAV